MGRYVSVDVLLKGWNAVFLSDEAKNIIRKESTDDVEEIKHAKWEISKTEFGWNSAEYPVEYKCSRCGGTIPLKNKEYSYCPHCGAKMDLKENKE